MGFVGSLLGIIGFGIGFPIGLLLGFIIFIYLQPRNHVIELTRPHSQSSMSLSSLKSNVPSKAASYSNLARGNWEDKTCGPG